ncbi:MAG TPA: GNAT family N-acetyltransferase [Chthonomonadaceae bacterium]|nr:GNAT family N-acetyltransferase [Chthonomonadaceae bacterium]
MCNHYYMPIEKRVSIPSAEYEVAPVTTTEEREAVFAIRMLVFVEEQAVPPEEELDIYDLTAAHFLVREATHTKDTGEIIATARLVDKGAGLGKIGRVAVLREHRGEGLGALLMRYVEEAARTQGFLQLILEAQLHAIPFYAKLGYVAEGDVYLDAGIEHRLMRKWIVDTDKSTEIAPDS